MCIACIESSIIRAVRACVRECVRLCPVCLVVVVVVGCPGTYRIWKKSPFRAVVKNAQGREEKKVSVDKGGDRNAAGGTEQKRQNRQTTTNKRHQTTTKAHRVD